MSDPRIQPIATSGHVLDPNALSSDRLDIPTLIVALAVYCSYFVLTWFFRDMPMWIAAPLCAICLTWYGSLQHETIHDHPTPSRRLNMALASPPLSLWIPYRIYHATHRQHHRHGGHRLTEVADDPESFYMETGTLSRSGSLQRAVYLANCTLSGRLIVGPALAVFRFWALHMRKAIAGNQRHRTIWARHAIGVMLVFLWTAGVCHIPIAVYVMFVVYPSMSLSQLRSFVEHRANPDPTRRTVTVEANALWALLFLNNNLHIAHHAHPHLPWHKLPRVWRQMRDHAMGSGLVFHCGYRQVAGNYLFRPVIGVEHPGEGVDVIH